MTTRRKVWWDSSHNNYILLLLNGKIWFYAFSVNGIGFYVLVIQLDCRLGKLFCSNINLNSVCFAYCCSPLFVINHSTVSFFFVIQNKIMLKANAWFFSICETFDWHLTNCVSFHKEEKTSLIKFLAIGVLLTSFLCPL